MKYNVKKIFARNIKRIRTNHKLTQEKFAELVGMQFKSISNLEAARSVANSENLENICNTLDVAPSELFLFFNENEDDKQKIEKINIILNKMSSENLDLAYRFLSVLHDPSHFRD